MTDEAEPLNEIEPDPWTRFDMWADRAHEAITKMIEAEQKRLDGHLTPETTSALADIYREAAEIYRDLAEAAGPSATPPPLRIPIARLLSLPPELD